MTEKNRSPKLFWVATATFLVLINILLAGTALRSIEFEEDQKPRKEVLGVNTSRNGYIRRFTTTTQGGLLFAGNTAALSMVNNPGNGSAGAFIKAGSEDRFSPYPTGTTDKWEENLTEFTVAIPENSSVLYAELIWGGNHKHHSVDLTNELDSPIRFQTEQGTLRVNPDPVTSALIESDDAQNIMAYVRSANVTDIVKQNGSGTYGCGSIPGLIIRESINANSAGCTLAIAYANTNEVSRNLTIFVGNHVVDKDAGVESALASVSGFITPPTGDIEGKLFASAQEGDSVLKGDQMFFGQTEEDLTPLFGPNNQEDNFFASQINNSQGVLDTSGSFGFANQNPSDDIIPGGLRHGWDITSLDISDYLKPNQTSAVARATSQGDGYLLNGVGIQIDVKSPRLKAELIGTQQVDVCSNEEMKYSVTISNNGTADSTDTIVRSAIPQNTVFTSGSLAVNGLPTSGTISDGVAIGTLAPGDTVEISYSLSPILVDGSYNVRSQVVAQYRYQVLEDGQEYIGAGTSNIVTTEIRSDSCTSEVAPQPDVSETNVNEPVRIDVLANDPTSQLDLTCFDIASNPSFGTVVRDGDQIIYNPNQDYIGTDTFTYKVCQPDGDILSVPVIVTVKGGVFGTNGNQEPTRRGAVLGAFETNSPNSLSTTQGSAQQTPQASVTATVTPRSGAYGLSYLLLGIVGILGIGACIVPAALKEEKVPDDTRREF